MDGQPTRVILALALWLGCSAVAQAESLRLRVEWGGGAARQWEGSIALERGKLAEPIALGVEADEPGSMWLSNSGSLTVRQRSPRTYDGVDLSLEGNTDDTLVVHLSPQGESSAAQAVRIKLADVVNDFRNVNLDGKGNRLLVRRAPGDRLHVRMRHASMVFAPGEKVQLEVVPRLTALAADTRLRIAIQLLDARGASLWNAEHNAKAGDVAPVALSIPLPQNDGVYDIAITATQLGWQHTVWAPLGSKPAAERRVQLVVVGPQSPKTTSGDLSPVVEIDPANPRWWERFAKLPQLTSLGRLRKGPLGSGAAQVTQTELGPLTTLNPSRGSEISWEAYWLPLSRAGVPHVLEVDYPADATQTLGISVIEPNAAGAVTPIGIDSGVDQTGELGGAPRWARQRVIFWPKTRAPLVLISNLSRTVPASYGKIRILGGWEHLPKAFHDQVTPARMLAGYMDRPLLGKNFSASETLDAWSGRSLDDWTTFYEAGTRLVEYLHYSGYDGLMVSVLSEGSALYPSDLLQPTPRHDTGAFFDSGQDPLRKDVLEMLLRLFDRERLRLVPSLDFSAPLPQIEEMKRQTADADSLDWIGPDGNPLSMSCKRGVGPHYNLLDPRVQQAMLAVIREVVARYGQHTSLGGLGLRLSADNYAQLPGPEWGLDDATIARFERDTRLRVPGEGDERFAQRAKFLSAEPARRAWLGWRAEQAARFYRAAQQELEAAGRPLKLFLAGPEHFSSPDMQYELRPTLPRRNSFADAMLQVGLDLRQFSDEQVVLLRPERMTSAGRLSAEAVQLELRQMSDFDGFFANQPAAGCLFFQSPCQVRVPTFDEKSPFRPAYTELLSQLAPPEGRNRKRFVHSLAVADPQTLFDGGSLLPLGQDQSLVEMAAVYRKLPAARFERLVESAGETAQPVVIRTCAHDGVSYAYLVNDSPFPVTLKVGLALPAGCRMEELSGLRTLPSLETEGEQTIWKLPMKPYDLVGVRFSATGVQWSRPVATLTRQTQADLALKIRSLGVRNALLVDPPPLALPANAGFETTADTQPAGWTFQGPSGARPSLDAAEKHEGKQSVRLASDGPVIKLSSEPFVPPSTGRLAVSVWLRVADERRQPPLRIALEGVYQNCVYYRYAPLGRSTQPGQPAAALAPRWAQYIFQIDDLPLEGLSQVRVGFELVEAGEVWVDDIQMFDLRFSKMERVELAKLISLADVKLQNGQIADCLRLLDGYWPQFLEANVRLPSGEPAGEAVAKSGKHRPRSDEEPPANQDNGERTGLMDRVRGLLPQRLRF